MTIQEFNSMPSGSKINDLAGTSGATYLKGGKNQKGSYYNGYKTRFHIEVWYDLGTKYAEKLNDRYVEESYINDYITK